MSNLKVVDKSGITGVMKWELRGPDGKIKQSGENHNIVVDEGDDMVSDRMALTPTIPVVIGMSLGTGYVGAPKNTVWLTTGYAGNYKAFDATYPKIKAAGADANILQLQCTFAAGEATSNGIDEACITNVSSAGNGLHPENSWILAYAQITPEVNKGAADTLVILWSCTVLGS